MADNNEDHENTEIMPFWSTDPNIILNTKYLTEFFPTPEMSLNQKLNAISRCVIILTLLLFVMTSGFRFVIIGIITLGVIWFIHHKNLVDDELKENFDTKLHPNPLPEDIFDDSPASNPLQNVMIQDYDNAASKKTAPPSYTEKTQSQIMEHTKNMIDKMNPEQPKISEKLFKSLEDNLAFEQSMRPFYSNPSTTIPNDQSSFADFCYGTMVSCKEGNPLACNRNLPRYVN